MTLVDHSYREVMFLSGHLPHFVSFSAVIFCFKSNIVGVSSRKGCSENDNVFDRNKSLAWAPI
jgi:hypothetical protein